MKTTLIISFLYIAIINSCNENSKSSTKVVPSDENSVTPDSQSNNNEIKNELIPAKKFNYFTLLNSVSENWTSGAPGGGSGIEYYFKVKINTSDKILFDSAWIDNKVFKIFISKDVNSIADQPIVYDNGDTITLRVSEIRNQNKDKINVTPPEKNDGAALIRYFVNGKREYFSIKEIKKQKSANRP